MQVDSDVTEIYFVFFGVFLAPIHIFKLEYMSGIWQGKKNWYHHHMNLFTKGGAYNAYACSCITSLYFDKERNHPVESGNCIQVL